MVIALAMTSCTVNTGAPEEENTDTIEEAVITTTSWTAAPTAPTTTDRNVYGAATFATGTLTSPSIPGNINMVAVNGSNYMMMHQQFNTSGSVVTSAWNYVPNSPTFKTSDAFNANGGAALAVAPCSWARERYIVFGIDRSSGYVKYIIRELNTVGNWVWGNWNTLTEMGTVQSIGVERPRSSSSTYITLVARNTAGSLVYGHIRTDTGIPYTSSNNNFYGPWALNSYTYPEDQVSNPVVIDTGTSGSVDVYYIRIPNRSSYSYIYHGVYTGGTGCNGSYLGGPSCWTWSILPKPTASGSWKKFNTQLWRVNATSGAQNQVCQVASYVPTGGSQQLYQRCSVGSTLNVFGTWGSIGAQGNWDYTLPMASFISGGSGLYARLYIYETQKNLFSPSNKNVKTYSDQ